MKAFNEYFRENRFREARDDFRSRFGAPPTGFKEVGQLTEEKLNAFNRWSEACLYLGEENSGFQALKRFVEDLEKNSHKNWAWLKNLNERLAIEITESVIHLSNFYFYFGKYAKSLDLAELSQKLKQEVLNIKSDARNARPLARTSVVMGKAYWKLGNFYDAILSFLRSIEYLIIANTYNNDEEGYMVGRCFCLLGEVYLDLNSLDLAEDFLKSSLNIMEKRSQLVDNHLYVGIANNVLGRILARKGKVELDSAKAEGLFSEARDRLYDAKHYLSETFKDAPFHRYKANNLCNIAMRDWYCFYRLTEPEIHFSPPKITEFDKVVANFKDEIEHREKCFDRANKYHSSKANAHINLAKVYLLSNLLEKAKASSLSAIKVLAPELGQDQWALPKNSEGRRMEDISWITLFKALEVHLKILWAEFSVSLSKDCQVLTPSQQSLYDQGMNVSRLCLDIYNNVLNNGNSPLKVKDPGIVRMLYSRQASLIIELRLKFLYRQYQCHDRSNGDSDELNDKIFQSFRTQRNIFLSSVNERGMANNEDDTNRLFNKTEKSIVDMLEGLTGKEQTNKAQRERIILDTIQYVHNEQIKLKKQIKIRSEFVASLRTQESSEEGGKGKTDNFNLSSIHSHFEKTREGKILSYVLGEDSLFVMIISNKDNAFDFKNLLTEHPNPKQAIDEIKSSTHEVETIINNTIWETSRLSRNSPKNKQYANLEPEINTLDTNDLNVKLYHHLIKLNSFLISPLNLSEDKRIYVIPDGELNFLNFGLLTPDIIESRNLFSNGGGDDNDFGTFKFSDLAFLDRRIEVSYAISSESLYSNHVHETDVAPMPINGALSMVVTGRVNNQQKFERTAESDIFVKTYNTIAKLAPNQHTTFDSTQPYIREDFYEAYENATMAYLHVHSRKQDFEDNEHLLGLIINNNKIEDENLLTQEHILEHLQSKTQLLLVLNACRARWGRMERTGSISSLLNAFIKNGSKNILSNIYRIDGATAENISIDFLRKLIKGHTMGEALHLVKRKMIEKDTFSHPTYWGASVFFGNAQLKIQPARDEEE